MPKEADFLLCALKAYDLSLAKESVLENLRSFNTEFS